MSMRHIQEQALYNAICSADYADKAEAIVYGEQGGARGESDSAWVQSSMNRLEQAFDEATVKQIRMRCQCGYEMQERVVFLNELKGASSSLEEFAGSELALAAGLFCEHGELYLKFPFCPCPMLSGVDRLPSKTWCQCTAGYSKVLFQQVFGCPVDVELLKSIKAGDDICLMKITLNGFDWGSREQ